MPKQFFDLTQNHEPEFEAYDLIDSLNEKIDRLTNMVSYMHLSAGGKYPRHEKDGLLCNPFLTY